MDDVYGGETPQEDEIETLEEDYEDLSEEEETPAETEPEQSAEELKAEIERLKGINKRYETKLKKVPTNKTKETEGIDLGLRAFLNSSDIRGKEEHELAINLQKETGKDWDSLLESNYFKSELKDLRQRISVAKAIPNNSNRIQGDSKTKIDYWLAKNELPPVEQVQLRRDVVNAKIKIAQNAGKFSNQPIVQG